MAPLSSSELDALKDVATKLRIHSVSMTSKAKSGHPTSCSSMAELFSALFFRVMRYNVDKPKAASNDRFVLSKGHGAPILYAAWAEAGLFPVDDLNRLRTIDSDLEGHPTPRLNFIDVATGSLGQGLSVACGMAYCGKFVDQASYRVYCLLGDGESYEGNVWEALNFASFYKLDNLVAIIDVNRLGQSDPTPLQHDMDLYRARVESFGWHVIVVDGHDLNEIVRAFEEAKDTKDKPTCILAKTFKGKDFPGIEDQMNWHGKALGDKTEDVIAALKKQLINPGSPNPAIAAPVQDAPIADLKNVSLQSPPSYKVGEALATRQAYGNALLKLAQSNDRVIAMDGDMKNSTFSQNVHKQLPKQYVEGFICEQNIAGVGIGLACRDRVVAFLSTFSCFWTRAFDNFRMGVISQTNINIAGSHCGVSIGEDGPSQMGLEDLAMFRALPGATVFYPSDAVATEKAVELAANTKGICFIRLSRPATPVYYKNEESFQIGKAKVVRKSDSDKVLVIAAGVTLEQAVLASEALASEGVNVRVMDVFTVKPLDVEGIVSNAKESGNKIIVVEDHYPEGGLGSAVATDVVVPNPDFRLRLLNVKELPRSGPPKVLLNKYGIDSQAIAQAVRDFN